MIALLTICNTAGPATAQAVEVEVDSEADFSAAQTYAWRGGTQAPTVVTQRLIMQTIDEELQARGLELVDNEGDLYVTAFAVVDQKTRRRAVSLGVGVSRRTNRGSISVGGSTGGGSRQIVTGTLVIDIFDSASERLIWQAIAADTLKSDPQENSDRALAAISKSFEQFPLARRD
jgi:hypothetical protein